VISEDSTLEMKMFKRTLQENEWSSGLFCISMISLPRWNVNGNVLSGDRGD
jgi:hypothetical protein